jgi:hypothetical protein
MATFRTYAEVPAPDHPVMKLGRKTNRPPGVVLADVLRQTGGVYQTTTPLTDKFREDLREVAELTSDDELRRIAELPEVPVSLENCRQLDPQTRVVVFCRLDVSPAETPRWLPLPAAARYTTLRSELGSLLRAGRGARIEEHALPDGRFWHAVRPAADLPA